MIDELMHEIEQGGDIGEEATVRLGLLIQLVKTNFSSQEAKEGLQNILPKHLRGYRLSSEEIETAIVRLIDYIERTPSAIPGALIALRKTYDDRALPLMAKILLQNVGPSGDPDLAREALNTLKISEPTPESIPAIRAAAIYGTNKSPGRSRDRYTNEYVIESAREYFEFHSLPLEENA